MLSVIFKHKNNVNSLQLVSFILMFVIYSNVWLVIERDRNLTLILYKPRTCRVELYDALAQLLSPQWNILYNVCLASSVAWQHQHPRLNPDPTLLSRWSFVCSHHFACGPTSYLQKHYKLYLSWMCVHVCVWCPVMDSCPIKGTFLPQAQCSKNRLQIQNKAVMNKDEWIKNVWCS